MYVEGPSDQEVDATSQRQSEVVDSSLGMGIDMEVDTLAEVGVNSEHGILLGVSTNQVSQPPEVPIMETSHPSEDDFAHQALPHMSQQARRQRLRREKKVPKEPRKERLTTGRVKSAVKNLKASEYELNPRSFVRTRRVEHEDRVYDIKELAAMGIECIPWDGKWVINCLGFWT